MHVNVGPDASKLLLLDQQTANFVQSVYDHRGGRIPLRLMVATDPRLERLLLALDSGIYRTAFLKSGNLFRSSETRRHAGDPVSLADAKMLVPVAIWRSIRQDVLYSTTLKSHAPARVSVARKLGESGDWNTAMLLLAQVGLEQLQDPGYLSASFPAAFRGHFYPSNSGIGRPAGTALCGRACRESTFGACYFALRRDGSFPVPSRDCTVVCSR